MLFTLSPWLRHSEVTPLLALSLWLSHLDNVAEAEIRQVESDSRRGIMKDAEGQDP